MGELWSFFDPIQSFGAPVRSALKEAMEPTCKRVLSEMLPDVLAATAMPLLGARSDELLHKYTLTTVFNQSQPYPNRSSMLAYGKSWGQRQCRNLMVVRDPDDDLIFGGETALCSSLYDDSLSDSACWKIVVTTDGGRLPRRSDWKRVQSAMRFARILGAEFEVWRRADSASLSSLLSEREWDVVYTHSLYGEYGQDGHRYISQQVVKFHQTTSASFALWFFNPRPDRPTPPSYLKLWAMPIYANERTALRVTWFWTETPVVSSAFPPQIRFSVGDGGFEERGGADPESYDMPLFPDFRCHWSSMVSNFYVANKSFSPTGRFNNTGYTHLDWDKYLGGKALEPEKAAEASLSDLKAAEASLSDLKAAEASLSDLKAAEASLSDLKAAEASLSDLSGDQKFQWWIWIMVAVLAGLFVSKRFWKRSTGEAVPNDAAKFES